jgi:predicted regulator of Ras-like GTPase activity (Roadblock/LC7/MglB family)
MATAQMVMYPEDARLIQGVCDQLHKNAQAKAVLCIDKNGQPIALSGGDEALDVTSLSSLTAGTIAATGGIAKLLEEREFSGQFHEGEKTHVHISIVGQRMILVVLFDDRSSLGLVRLRVRKATEELNRVLDAMLQKQQAANAPSVFAEITDEDIDNLFND